jgi:hypothetical protein
MIRVANPYLMGGFLGVREGGYSSGRIRSFSLVVRGCADGYDDLENVCRACLWGDVTWNRVGSVDCKNSIYRRIQSPRSVSFRSSMAHLQKTKASRPLVAQNQFTMVIHCRSPSL